MNNEGLYTCRVNSYLNTFAQIPFNERKAICRQFNCNDRDSIAQ